MFIVYKTINKITGHYYWGVHKTNTLDFDGYLGSGLRIKKSVTKYGAVNFIRETVYIFTDVDERLAFEKEKEIIAQDLGNILCLNLAEGGKGGPHFKGKKHKPESIVKSITTRKLNGYKPKPLTPDQRIKRKEARLQTNGGMWFLPQTLEKFKEIKRQNTASRPAQSDQIRAQISVSVTRYFQNPNNRKKQSEAMMGKNKGRIYITHQQNKITKAVKLEQLSFYLEQGYRLGR